MYKSLFNKCVSLKGNSKKSLPTAFKSPVIYKKVIVPRSLLPKYYTFKDQSV